MPVIPFLDKRVRYSIPTETLIPRNKNCQVLVASLRESTLHSWARPKTRGKRRGGGRYGASAPGGPSGIGCRVATQRSQIGNDAAEIDGSVKRLRINPVTLGWRDPQTLQRKRTVKLCRTCAAATPAGYGRGGHCTARVIQCHYLGGENSRYSRRRERKRKRIRGQHAPAD